MDSLLESATTYVEVLRNCSSPKVAHWKQEDLERAVNWAEYFQRVHGRIQKKPAVVRKFDVQLRQISLQTSGGRFSQHTLTAEFLGNSLDYLLKSLLENPSLPDDIKQSIHQKYATEGHIEHVEKVVCSQSLLETLTLVHSKLSTTLPTHAPPSLRCDPLLVADAMVLQDEAEWMLSNTEPPHSAVHAKLDQLAMQEDGMMVILLSILPQSHLTVADTSTPAEPISGHTENSKSNAPHFIMNWLEQNLQATPQTTPTTKPHPQETESSAKVVCETFWSLSPDLLAGIAAQSVDFFRFFYKALSHRVNQLQTELLEPGGGTETGVCPERFEREAACYFRSLMAVNESVREVTVALVESQVEETAVKVLAVGMKTSGKCGSGDQCERFTPCSAAKLPFNLWRTVLATAHRE